MNNEAVICIIDDDEVYQYTARKAIRLQKMMNKIQVFSDGERALEFLAKNNTNLAELPDVIFLDLNMPIMDGWQFLDEYVNLKPRIGKEIVIYIVSSSVDPIDLERAKKINEVTDFMVKPVSGEKISEIVGDLLNS